MQRTSETALLNDKFSRTVFCWSDPFSRHRTMGIRFPGSVKEFSQNGLQALA